MGLPQDNMATEYTHHIIIHVLDLLQLLTCIYIIMIGIIIAQLLQGYADMWIIEIEICETQ